MLPIVAYIVACFLCGLYFRAPRSRRRPWILLATCALLCASYLAAGETFLPGLSLFSVSSGGEHLSEGGSPALRKEPIPGLMEVLPRAESAVSNAFAKFRSLEGSAAAARVAVALYLLGAAAILFEPRYGLYLILFGALLGDAILLPWYPFVKGCSSPESLFFVDDRFIVSPLEIYIVLTALSWSARRIRRRDLHVVRGPLFWPAMAFSAALVCGLAYGIGTGGDLRIALWEARAVFYLVPLLLLTSNLVDEPAHATWLLWAALAAVFLKGVVASLYYLLVLRGDLNGVEGIAEHGAAIHLNALFVAALAAWIFTTSRSTRIVLPLLLALIALGYIAMQRRAAFVTLAVASVLLLAFLFKQRRGLFWRVAPAFLLLSAGYVAIGWNGRNTLAIPARAIQSAIVARQASGGDQSSNDHRMLENRNIAATIHAHPLAGIGFGQKYSMAVPMTDLSRSFEWWEYITHNSILWIWMKAGLAGFFALLCLMGLAVLSGVRSLDRLPWDGLGFVVLMATLYLVMHFIYAGVDMSWDAASIVFVGALMGVIDRAESIAARRA